MIHHPCAAEHPYRLLDAPNDVLLAWWQDGVLSTADSADVFEAWQAIPQPRAAS